ncbi:AMP-binding enzyme [Polaromonas sp. OV174]|nr:AMP-binding enzyme [Polaromonas sp. OV174]
MPLNRTQMLSRAPSDADFRRYRDAPLSRSPMACDKRPDGTLLLRALAPPLDGPAHGFSSFVAQWADTRGAVTAIAERQGKGGRSIHWADFHTKMLAVAAGLLDIQAGRSGPLMILSGNSIEQAVLTMAAEYVGIAVAPVSANYSLQAGNYARLRGMYDLVEPATVFVQSSAAVAGALEALGIQAEKIIAVDDVAPGHAKWSDLASAVLFSAQLHRVEEARAAIRPGDTARIFFTSGSTGTP